MGLSCLLTSRNTAPLPLHCRSLSIPRVNHIQNAPIFVVDHIRVAFGRAMLSGPVCNAASLGRASSMLGMQHLLMRCSASSNAVWLQTSAEQTRVVCALNLSINSLRRSQTFNINLCRSYFGPISESIMP